MNFHKRERTLIGDRYYDVALSNIKWPQQKQFSPTFRNITVGETKAL
jgi:hypothetical protein